MSEPKGFCTACRYEIVSFDGLEKCPNCGSVDIPCSYENQVNVSVNWHEFHLLCVWAENYGRSIHQTGLVYGIAHALEGQYPGRLKLTIAGEVNKLKKEFPDIKLTDAEGNDIQT